MKRNIPIQSIWKTKHYYQTAKQASVDLNHPGLIEIVKLAQNAHHVLEVGCGEGTKLNLLVPEKVNATGIDISPTAVRLAQKQYPNRTFLKADANQLPFDSNLFDLVYLAYVLELTSNPERVINEMIRVLKPNGHLVIIAPNFGAGHRRSPCFRGNRIVKFLSVFLKDFFICFYNPYKQRLSWQTVKPIASIDNYQINSDTLTEPYLGSLIHFLEDKQLTIKKISSCWEITEKNEKLPNKILRHLSRLNLFPYIYWGPHILIVACKRPPIQMAKNILIVAINFCFIPILLILPFSTILLSIWLGVKEKYLRPK